jgi:ATP-dependent Clp protease ATP-binding subunit ClpC
MFERFTERARQVVVLAQEEARTLKHNYIGTEHILLGLLREEEGLAARVLESLDITVERVRGQVVRIVGSGEEVTSGQIPFTPRAKKVLELALREALSLGHNYIGTEHILLGLVRENEGVAARILLDFDADSEKIRGGVIRMLSEPGVQAYGEPVVRVSGDPEGAGWEPGLHWQRASVRWTPNGPELVVPLHLEQRACALLGASRVWEHATLAGVQHGADMAPFG